VQYGTGYSRDIEPTEEGGDLLYRIMASCIRVFRTGALTCGDASELCCQDTDFDSIWTYFGKPKSGKVFGLYSPALNGANSIKFLLTNPSLAVVPLFSFV
jgi:hypothetical protein